MAAHKASSVTAEGQPDGFAPPLLFRPEAAPDGTTRLKISAAPGALPGLHRALVEVMGDRLGVLYVQLTDRRAGRHLAEKPRRFIGMELAAPRVLQTLGRCGRLLYGDGRGQLWVRGALGEQLILDEMGLMYAYPDDPLFRDVLEAHGVPERAGQTLDERDYVRVEFQAAADFEEDRLLQELSLTPFTQPAI
jgi:hypothetical protein